MAKFICTFECWQGNLREPCGRRVFSVSVDREAIHFPAGCSLHAGTSVFYFIGRDVKEVRDRLKKLEEI